MRCDMLGRGGSSDELSEKGLLPGLGLVSWNSVSSESRLPAGFPRSDCCARAWLSSSSKSEARLPLRARSCNSPSSDEIVEAPVRGRACGTRSSGGLTRVRSVSADELADPAELLGVVISVLFFLVMLRALTGPSWAMLRTELAGLIPGM